MFAKVNKFFVILYIFSISFFSCNDSNLRELREGEVYVANIQTNMGNIRVQLLNETPEHRDNFVTMATSGYYDNLLFHRVIKGFVIQAGDTLTRNRSEEARAKYNESDATHLLDAEISSTIHHYSGALGAARDSNPEKRSSGNQFYIIHSPITPKITKLIKKKIKEGTITKEVAEEYLKRGGAPHLDGNYTVFGYVIKGLNVVEDITNVKVNDKDCPLSENDVEILGVKVKIAKE